MIRTPKISDGIYAFIVYAKQPVFFNDFCNENPHKAEKTFLEIANKLYINPNSVKTVLKRHNARIRFDENCVCWIGDTPRHGSSLREEMEWQDKTMGQKIVGALLPDEYAADYEEDTTAYREF